MNGFVCCCGGGCGRWWLYDYEKRIRRMIIEACSYDGELGSGKEKETGFDL